MRRVRVKSESITKHSLEHDDDKVVSMVRSSCNGKEALGIKQQHNGGITTTRKEFHRSDHSKTLCDGLFYLIKSTQSIDGIFLQSNCNENICGKCISCQEIKSKEDDRKSIMESKEASLVLSKTNILQPSTAIEEKVEMYTHFEFHVDDLSDEIGQKIDYYKMKQSVFTSDWDSDWMYYKKNNKFESYVRRYVLHSETPVEQIPDAMLQTGLLCGTFMAQMLLILVIVVCNWPNIYNRFVELIIVWRLIRSILFVIIFLFLIAINIYVWQRFGINHVLIFELDPRSHLKYQKIIKIAALFGNVWCISLINFILSESTNRIFWIWPFVCVVILLIWTCNPLPFAYYRARIWLLNVVLRVLASPLYKVNFSEFWLADQLNSISFVFVDLINGLYFCINYRQISEMTFNTSNTSGYSGISKDKIEYNRIVSVSSELPITIFLIVKILIIWFRLGQCLRRYHDVGRAFPHLANGGKYISSIITVVLTAIKLKDPSNVLITVIFIISSSVNTVYTYLWDILMDWSLFKLQKRSVVFREILYKKEYYIIAAILNGIIRCYWITVLFISNEFVVTFGIFLEVIRQAEYYLIFLNNVLI